MRVFVFLLAAAAYAQPNLPLPPAGAHAGYEVVDLATGSTIAASHQDEFFTPASNLKLYTTAFALDRLGPQYHFTTELRTRGPDLLLVGGGDPNLSGRVLPYNVDAPEGDVLAALRDLVARLKRSGVTVINGDVVGVSDRYARELIPDGWAWDDTVYGFGAPVSALALNDNSVSVFLSPSTEGELAALRLRPNVSDLLIVNQVVTAPPGHTELQIDRPLHSSELILRGTIGTDAPEFRADVAVADPALFAAIALTDLLREAGIAVLGEPRGSYDDASAVGTVVASYQSAPLSTVIQAMNKVSQNLHAEMLWREASLSGDRAQFLNAIQAPVDAQDGSGLAQSDLASPAGTINLLQHMWNGPNRDVWLNSLPIGGVDGTLQHRFTGVDGASRIHAKTGTLRHTNALSGYIETRQHAWLAFSIFVDEIASNTQDVRGFMDAFCSELLKQ